MRQARQFRYHYLSIFLSPMLLASCGVPGNTSMEQNNDNSQIVVTTVATLTPMVSYTATSSTASVMTTPTNTVVATDYTSARFVQDLRNHGASVDISSDRIDHGLTILSQRLEVNGENVYVYEYPDSATANTDTTTISPDGYNITRTKGTAIEVRHGDWIAPPHFYNKDRLIVVYAGSNATIIRMLETTLGPQFAGAAMLQSTTTLPLVPKPTAP